MLAADDGPASVCGRGEVVSGGGRGPGFRKEIVERPVPSALTVAPADGRPTRSAGKANQWARESGRVGAGGTWRNWSPRSNSARPRECAGRSGRGREQRQRSEWQRRGLAEAAGMQDRSGEVRARATSTGDDGVPH